MRKKKEIIKNLIETGKAKGVLTYSEITEALDELDMSMEQIEKLSSISLMNGVNALVSVCNAFNISKKWGESARIEMERLTAGGYAVNAHDLYLCLTEAIAEAVACNAKEQTRREIEDIINELKP